MTTLTKDQEAILAELFGPASQTLRVSETLRALPEMPAQPGAAATASPDLLGTWLGLSGGDLRRQVQAWLATKDGVERQVLAWLERNPLDAAFEFLAGAALAFYLAEKEVNPRVKSYVDAFYYIATCASVGYADLFAATQAGRAVAALVMIVGPSITARATNRPSSGRAGVSVPSN